MKYAAYQPEGRRLTGFTVVELLAVIVILGILAALIFVGANSISERAVVAKLKKDLSTAAELADAEFAQKGAYPASLDSITGFKPGDGVILSYNTEGSKFCVTAQSAASGASYFIDSDQNVITEGRCPIFPVW
ncbi:hypothetical protein B7Y94_02160 [Candidatus Saccharibacteria bacterium 32-49-12]|nr:MAG: hypothetical protein B7Y94_02160 [Candidatus Saccharibacteria bacterium 32-49-12]